MLLCFMVLYDIILCKEQIMVVIYQATFYLSIVLLAILITLFVLAVSLLGRAVRISIDEQEKAEQASLSRSQSEIQDLSKQFKKAEKSHIQPDIDRIQKSIKKIKWSQRFSKIKLRWICIKPKFLGVPLGVILPGSLFLVSIVTSTLAIYFESSSHNTALSLWYISLITVIMGMINILLTLRVTQSVAITSDEISYLRQKELMKSALIEVEEVKTPSLEFSFSDENPPFDIGADQQKNIDFHIHLTKGYPARNIGVMFFVPEGFGFPGHTTHKQPISVQTVAGLLSASVNFDYCTTSFDPASSINIKAPSNQGAYKAWYKVGCDRFDGELQSFDINVV